MILAAGRGTRLGPVGERRAKVLVEIDDRPLLAHQLRYLSAQGIERVVVNASHLADQLKDFVRKHSPPPTLELVVEPEALGTAGGVRNALPRFSSDPVLVLYGDVITPEGLAPMGDLHELERPVATLAVYRSDDVREKGVVDLSGSKVTSFQEKDPDLTSGWVNAGIYIVEPDWLRRHPDDRPLDFGFDLFPDALAAGEDLRAYRLGAPVFDLGTLPQLAEARERGLPQVYRGQS